MPQSHPAAALLRQIVPKPARSRLRRERQRWRETIQVASKTAAFGPPIPIAYRQLVAPRLRVLCYPKRPTHWQVLYKICAVNGYRIVTDPAEPHDLAVHFTNGGPCELPTATPVLNRHCTDISKKHVAAVFKDVFGYGLAVDPTSYEGPIVEKSDENYRHDGRILQAPLSPDQVDAGLAYQRLVDTVEDGLATDLRTPLYGGRPPLVYIKRRPADVRFSRALTSIEIREPQEVFSSDELATLTRFAAAMGLDYGELDILRDRASGRIYVVDVANTPGGPTMPLPLAREGLARLAREFEALAHAKLEAA